MSKKMHLCLIGEDQALAAILAEESEGGAFVFEKDPKQADVFIVSGGAAVQGFEPAIRVVSAEEDTPGAIKKPFRLSTLLEAASSCWRKIRADEEYALSPSAVLRPFRKEIEDKKQKKILALTDKEAAFLARVLESGEKGLPRAQVLTEVWGYHADSDSHAVDAALYRLRQKLQEIFGRNEVLSVRAGAYVWTGKKPA